MKLLKELMEADEFEPQPKRQTQRNTQSRERTQYDDRAGRPSIDSLFRDFMDQAQKNDIAITPAQQEKVKTAMQGTVVSSSATKSKLAGLSSPSPEVAAQAMRHMMDIANIDIQDTISDEQAARNAGHTEQDSEVRPQPVEPDNLPATINKNLKAAGKQEVEFMQVKHLPGYLKNPIRAMGRQVFSTFTNTAIEDISVIANLKQMGGPNDMSEINAVAGYARKHGTKDTQAELNFNQTIEGYEADVHVYSTEDTTFMLVKDFMGSYIYSWPSEHTKRLKENTESNLLPSLLRLAKDLRLLNYRSVTESAMKNLQSIIDDAEAKAFDNSSEDKSSVSGDAVMKHIKQELKRVHKGDVPSYNGALRSAEKYIAKEYGK